MRSAQILVVEDDDHLRKLFSVVLGQEGHEVAAAGSGAEALSLLGARLFDAALCDLWLPDIDGVELLRRIKAHDPTLEVIMMTGQPEVASAVEALKLGAYDYLTKPVATEELVRLVGRLVEHRALRQEVRSLRSRLGERLAAEDIVAASPAMQQVKAMIVQMAGADSTVVIEGETGTGKEVVAACIHRLSPRREKPFIPINCGALPGELVESELFGHVRGAFSGAVAEFPGLFRAAEGGTVLLDEVGELPLGLQVKLLRVLQERQVRPVGSTRSYDVDVRLLAATNRSLEEEVKQGRFRPDLFYRLNVVRIALPPLRDRREDVLPLASRFVRHLNDRYGRQVRGFAPDAARALQAYDFPGNVRELEHLLERAYALGLRDEVTLGDLPSSLLRASPPSPAEAGPSGPILGPLEQAEREAIVRALAQNGNDKSRAAETLGISRRTLYRRLKELHLGAEDPPP